MERKVKQVPSASSGQALHSTFGYVQDDRRGFAYAGMVMVWPALTLFASAMLLAWAIFSYLLPSP
jgi:hypothetical protein